MKVKEKTICAAADVLLGELDYCEYRTGREIVRFFHDHGSDDSYEGMEGSRRDYGERKLRELNGQDELRKVFSHLLEPTNFLAGPGKSDLDVDKAVEYLNTYLKFDGYELVKEGVGWVVAQVEGGGVAPPESLASDDPTTHEFMEDQIRKCRQKLSQGDYDGAITNARTLLEAALVEIEVRITGTHEPHGGDLVKLYKRVRKVMNLSAGPGLDARLNQILTGLASVVNGIATLRNTASDSHARELKPERRHAQLAMDAVHTLVEFFITSFDHQVKRGAIKGQGTEDAR